MHNPAFILTMSFIVLATAELHPDEYYIKFNKDGNEHTMVKYKGFGAKCTDKSATVVKSGPFTEEEKKEFLKYHNDYRRKVAKGLESGGAPGPQPQASNMRKMTWDDELAAFAQRWADQCPGPQEPHDHNRITDDFTAVGQNMFREFVQSAPMFGLNDPALKASAKKPVKFWGTVEAGNMNKNDISPFHHKNSVGHYTQIVWADSDKLGCGFVVTKREDFRIFYTINEFMRYVICNYGPGGNADGLEMYKIGEAGSDCPNGTSNNDGLCS